MTQATTWDQDAAAPDTAPSPEGVDGGIDEAIDGGSHVGSGSRARSGRRSRPIVRAIAIIALSALIVAVGGYAAGQYAGQLGAGQFTSTPRAAASHVDAGDIPGTAGEISTSSVAASSEIVAVRRPGLGDDLDMLHPQVAVAVLEARRQRVGAEAAERRAHRVAARARASSSGVDGLMVEAFDNGDLFEGEAVDGVRHGVGVYTWANAIEGTYGGQFNSGMIAGLGVKRWADGAAYYGSRSPEARDGHGVFAYAEGGGYEGAWALGAPDGYGVVWAPDGSVQSQGLWASNVLIEAWVAPVAGEAESSEDAGR